MADYRLASRLEKWWLLLGASSQLSLSYDSVVRLLALTPPTSITSSGLSQSIIRSPAPIIRGTKHLGTTACLTWAAVRQVKAENLLGAVLEAEDLQLLDRDRGHRVGRLRSRRRQHLQELHRPRMAQEL